MPPHHSPQIQIPLVAPSSVGANEGRMSEEENQHRAAVQADMRAGGLGKESTHNESQQEETASPSPIKTAPIKFSKRKKEVIKHSSAVQITNSITLLQRRAWNILLARAYDDLPGSDRYQIRVRDLIEMLDYNSNDDAHLKEALEKLTTTAVRWNILRKDQSTEWGVFPLLAGAVIKQGVLTYAFSPFLKERLHNPRMYARISLSFQNKFQSKHALALYELCLDYFDFDRGYGETPFISVGEFRELMGVADEEYQSFARLNEKVIKKAINEINALCDLAVTVRFERKMRKIDALKFCVNRRMEMVLPFSGGNLEPVHKQPTPPRGRRNTQAQEEYVIEQKQLEYDVMFAAFPPQQQETIMMQAFEALPPFVKSYLPDNSPNVHDKATQILLRHERNQILEAMLQQSRHTTASNEKPAPQK